MIMMDDHRNTIIAQTECYVNFKVEYVTND